jgi:hypothetical protein
MEYVIKVGLDNSARILMLLMRYPRLCEVFAILFMDLGTNKLKYRFTLALTV